MHCTIHQLILSDGMEQCCQNWDQPYYSVWQNRSFGKVDQILMAITLSLINGISRIFRIATSIGDRLVKTLPRLNKSINENLTCMLTEDDALSAMLKALSQSGHPRITKREPQIEPKIQYTIFTKMNRKKLTSSTKWQKK